MIKLIISFFVVFSGCNATKISSIHDNSQTQIVQQQSVKQETEFQSILSGRAETADGTPFSFNSYKSSDGIAISTRLETRKSPVQAKKELARNIKEAIEVIERKPKFDENNNAVGERAILTIRQEGVANPRTMVVWTVGPNVHFIESQSLKHALEFENWYLHNL